MKYLDEFRDSTIATYFLGEIKESVTQQCRIMEICGGQTHSIIQHGIDQLLPPEIELVHGPGCPVCVTPIKVIDRAIEIAKQPDVIFTSFGDMLRVPGSGSNLLQARSAGADIRFVYSSLEALKIAKENPDKQVVFFAIGFETTAPGNAMAIQQASNEGIDNFSELVNQVMVPPAMQAILSAPHCKINGFLAAGHVCSIMGHWQYDALAAKFNIPIVVTGFEPVDLLHGILMVVQQLENGKAQVENQYKRSVTRQGNTAAQEMLDKIFEITDNAWRGIGTIPASGLKIREPYQQFDALYKYPVQNIYSQESGLCISGQVLQGEKKPNDCPAFGKECTPMHPLGATMVSSEGACAAYYKYHRFAETVNEMETS